MTAEDVTSARLAGAAGKSRLKLIIAGLLVLAVAFLAVTYRGFDSADKGVRPANSIAVLPFLNMSGGASQEYFSDGITEELLNRMTKVPELLVTSRTSAFAFKGKEVDVPAAAAKLNVAHVLEGSVRKSGKTIRIDAQLVDAKTDLRIWSKTYDRTLDDIFTVQDDIAAAVMQGLKLTLPGPTLKARETMPEAYALYLKAGYFFHQGSISGFEHAEELYKAVLGIDPGYAPAWVRLAAVYNNLGSMGVLDNKEGHALASYAVKRALDIDPESPDALAQLALTTRVYEWDFELADSQIRRAREIDPGNAVLMNDAATMAQILGRFDEAIALKRQAIDCDPLSASRYSKLGNTYYYAGRYDDAIASYEQALALSPGIVGVQYNYSRVLLAQGEYEAALAMAEREPGEGWQAQGMSLASYKLGQQEKADVLLVELIDNHAREMAYQIAETYAYRNQTDQAFGWLERAYDNRDSGLSEILIDPLFSNLHGDLRWNVFLDKMQE